MAALGASPLRIGFIGDSLTSYGQPYGNADGSAGATFTTADAMAARLRQWNTHRSVTIVNQGVSGSFANGINGHATNLEWQPADSTIYATACAAFAVAGVQWVSIMLGTNDSRIDLLSAVDYATAIGNIATDLVSKGYKVILNAPPASDPANDVNSSYAKLDLQRQYAAALQGLVNGSTIFMGDTLAWAWTAQHYEDLRDGIHPNSTGVDKLGYFWAKALSTALNISPTSGSGGGSGTGGSGSIGRSLSAGQVR